MYRQVDWKREGGERHAPADNRGRQGGATHNHCTTKQSRVPRHASDTKKEAGAQTSLHSHSICCDYYRCAPGEHMSKQRGAPTNARHGVTGAAAAASTPCVSRHPPHTSLRTFTHTPKVKSGPHVNTAKRSSHVCVNNPTDQTPRTTQPATHDCHSQVTPMRLLHSTQPPTNQHQHRATSRRHTGCVLTSFAPYKQSTKRAACKAQHQDDA